MRAAGNEVLPVWRVSTADVPGGRWHSRHVSISVLQQRSRETSMPRLSHGAPIVRQHLQQPGRQHDVAVFLSLTLLHAQHHALAIDSLRLQPGRLGNTQACGITCRQDRLVFEALDAAKEVQHLLGAENDGQCLWRLGARNDPGRNPNRGRA